MILLNESLLNYLILFLHVHFYSHVNLKSIRASEFVFYYTFLFTYKFEKYKSP
jgi:hypothetical protein